MKSLLISFYSSDGSQTKHMIKREEDGGSEAHGTMEYTVKV